MNLRKPLVLLLLLLAACVAAISPALAATTLFSDVPDSHPYAAAIADLSGRGIISGYDDGTFRPNALVSRQQFAKMIVKTLGLAVTGTEVCPFTDVAAQSGADPFYPAKYVAVCASHGITNGTSATTFAPTGNITRQQLITMVVRAAALAEPPDGYAPDFFPAQFSLAEHFLNARKAAYAGLLAGLQGVGPSFEFSAPSTRGECAQILHNLLQHSGSSTTTSGGGTSTTLALLRFVKTVQVTPDATHPTGGFCRINYVPATDRFAVTFAGQVTPASGGTAQNGFIYKEYSLDMQETGKSGVIVSGGGDTGSVMVGSTYYLVTMARQGETDGWRLLKIDATTWTTLVEKFFPLDYPKEETADPMVTWVNGQLDISSQYRASGTPPGKETAAGTYGTFHELFSADLQFLGEKILTQPPHIHGSSMVFVGGVYYLVTSNLYDGDMLVAKYDKDWKYLGGKSLIKQAHFCTGMVYDGGRFYVAYTDTSQRGEHFYPVYLNIHLAVFDSDWNLLEDVAVTDYSVEDNMQTGRPWVIKHGNRLYVSYDLDTRDPITHDEEGSGQSYVGVYELTQ